MNPYDWKTNFQATIWIVILVIAIAFNAVIVAAVQSFGFQIEDPDTYIAETYADFTVLEKYDLSHNLGYLLESRNGDTHIVTMEQFLHWGKYRVIPRGTGVIPPEEANYSNTVLGQMGNISLAVQNHTAFQQFRSYGMGFNLRFGNSYLYIPSATILYSAAALIVEALIYALIRKVTGKD